jgi:hypothetical protein
MSSAPRRKEASLTTIAAVETASDFSPFQPIRQHQQPQQFPQTQESIDHCTKRAR